MTTVLCGSLETTCTPVRSGDADGLWLGADTLARATGWALKPEGLCRDDVCVPVAGSAAALVRDGAVDAAGLWRHLGHPVVHDAAREAWVLGESSATRARALQSLEAPDFALPDLAGRTVSLAQQRGRKVLLATWASW